MLRSERLDNPADQRREVQIRRVLPPEGVERSNLDQDLGMDRQTAEGFDLFRDDRAARADPTEVINEDRRVGKPPAHPVDLGEGIRVDQAAQGLSGFGRLGEHTREPRRL